MARLSPTDKELKEGLDPPHEIADPANRKKHFRLITAVLAAGKVVREILPDDKASSEPLYLALLAVSRESRKVFERRSGKHAAELVTAVSPNQTMVSVPPSAPVRGVAPATTPTETMLLPANIGSIEGDVAAGI